MSLPATFDHAAARALYATGEWTHKQLAERFGVSPSRIYQVVNPEVKARTDAASAAWSREHYNRPCRACGARIWKCGHRPNTGLCRECAGLARRTAEHGTETRYSSGCRCHACREAASAAKRARRECSRVPCSHGCGRMVDSINRHNPEKPPECRPCSIARIHGSRARELEAMSATRETGR